MNYISTRNSGKKVSFEHVFLKSLSEEGGLFIPEKLKKFDYKKANIPMLPLTNGIENTKINILIYSILMLPLTNGIENTKKNILIYSILMLPVIIAPYLIGFVSKIYLFSSLILTVYYIYLCYELYNFKKNKFEITKAKKVFSYSILYLFLLFVLFLVDKIF